MTLNLLILGGTSQARDIADFARKEPGVEATVSLGRPDRRASDMGLPTLLGGFGGPQGLRDFIVSRSVTAVLDATHPFATAIGHRAADVARDLSIDYARFVRPGWQPTPQDRWTSIDDEAEAAAHIGPADVVFLATGRQNLSRFANLAPRKVYCRRLDIPAERYPYEGGVFLHGKAPFTVPEEETLFRELRIDWLVIRNSGGQGSWPKVEAARNLGLRVALVDRPPQPPGTRLETMAEAQEWIRSRR